MGTQEILISTSAQTIQSLVRRCAIVTMIYFYLQLQRTKIRLHKGKGFNQSMVPSLLLFTDGVKHGK